MSTASEPNKPMVPTATHGLDEDSMTSWRRHIGQSFDSFGATNGGRRMSNS